MTARQSDERTESTVNLENQLIQRIKLIVWPKKIS
jgi:hypothetical protein